jgi:hypothetical protein
MQAAAFHCLASTTRTGHSVRAPAKHIFQEPQNSCIIIDSENSRHARSLWTFGMEAMLE